jgi:hypothetical protein
MSEFAPVDARAKSRPGVPPSFRGDRPGVDQLDRYSSRRRCDHRREKYWSTPLAARDLNDPQILELAPSTLKPTSPARTASGPSPSCPVDGGAVNLSLWRAATMLGSRSLLDLALGYAYRCSGAKSGGSENGR